MDWKNLKNIKAADIFSKIFKLFLAKISWIFLALAIILAAICCYIWYSYIYHSDWSADKKQSYVQTKEKSIALDREKFDKFIQETNDRQIEFQKDLSITSDIFRLKK